MQSSFWKQLILFCLVMGLVFWLPNSPAHAVQLQLYEASIEMTDSRPSQPSNWTIRFTTTQVIPVNGSISITPDAGRFTIPVAMDYEDFDLTIDAAEITLAAAAGTGASSPWGVIITSGTNGLIVLKNNDTDVIAGDSEFVIEIGTVATAGSPGVEMILNPTKTLAAGAGDTWEIAVRSRDDTNATIDKITLLVSIIESTNLYVGTRPDLTFTISGVTPPAGGVIDADQIEWREMTPGVAKTATMKVKVNTSATDGFTVFVRQDQNLTHAVNATVDIDPIKNVAVGTNDTPVVWASPPGTVIAVDTGYLGYTTSDDTLNNVGDGVNRFANETKYSGFTTGLEEILFHNTAAQSDVEGQDYTNFTLQLEINTLQPTGNYTNEVLYIVKPTF